MKRSILLIAALTAGILAAVVLAATPPPFGLTASVISPGNTLTGEASNGALPKHGALVHLKANICNQSTTLTVRDKAAGGLGLVIKADGNTYHWLSSPAPAATATAQGVSNIAIAGGQWVKIDFLQPGSYSLAYASSDCSYGAVNVAPEGVTTQAPYTLYDATATKIRVKVTG